MKNNILIIPASLSALQTLLQIFNSGFSSVQESLLNFLSHLLITGILTVYLSYSELHKGPRYFAIFWISCIFGSFNNLIEAYLFDVTSQQDTLKLMEFSLVNSLVVTFVLGRFVPVNPSPSATRQHRKWFSWAGRILAGDFLYTFLYGLAGFILVTVYPQMMDFYEGKIPDGQLVLLTQIGFRGFIFTFTALLITQTTNGSTMRIAILTGAMLSLIGGIAPLVNVNAFMPWVVRFGHLFEVGISNFLFGFLAALMMNTKKTSVS